MMTPRIWPPLRRRIRSPRASTPPASTASRAIGTSLDRLVTRGPAIGANLPSVLRSTGGTAADSSLFYRPGKPRRNATRPAPHRLLRWEGCEFWSDSRGRAMSQAVAEHRAEAPKSLSLAVLTVSDTRTAADDTSGALIVERVEAEGHRVLHRAI